MIRGRVGIGIWLVLLCGSADAQDSSLPPGEKEPVLRLEPGGPTSFITSLAFGPDGQTLYAGGWDKVVRVWRRDAATGQFALDPRGTYRVPIGPGLDGTINALALSPDGTWLAVAGRGVVRSVAGFRQPGFVLPSLGAMTDAMRRDQGMIYLFQTRTGAVRLLRGHLGPVIALAFASGDGPPCLVSAAQESVDGSASPFGAVRLWDVAGGTYLDGLGNLPDPKTRPGLLAWRTGEGPRQVRVAIAWGDGKLRLWDAERSQGRLWETPEGVGNDSLVWLTERSQFLSGSVVAAGGQLRAWKVRPNRAEVGGSIPFPPEADAHAFPRALATLARRAGAPPDLAAVVLFRPARGDEYRLDLLDLSPNSFGHRKGRVALWRGGGKMPVLAASPDGQLLAVAGNPGQEIDVYSVQDILGGRAEPQRLVGAGTTVRGVAWLKTGDEPGLRLTDGSGDLAFDFAKGRLTPDLADWSLDAPAPEGWSAEPVAGRPSVTLLQQGRPIRRIDLDANQVVTAAALLPPRPPLAIPLVAIASHEGGQPALGLYNGQTGEEVRQLTGHAERITSLAFNGSGTLLVSSAEDRTVSVWGLADLDAILGRRGRVPGLALSGKDGKLVVAGADPGELKVGDTLEGFVGANGLQAVPASPLDFYNAVSLLKPGQVVTVLRTRGGAAREEVPLRVGQGIDERKPLLSLFIIRGNAKGRRGWIGWNPLGPYEASDPEAERLLGWHVNTGKADLPTSFALADQYRKEYYREGLLRHLVVHGTPPPPPAPPAPPKTTLILNPATEAGGLVRRPPDSLQVGVFDFPTDLIASVRWRLDDGPLQDCEWASDQEWTANLAKLDLKRGSHTVRVVLRTSETEPRDFHEVRSFRYQPPAPSITTSAREPIVLNGPDFNLPLTARPGRPGEEFTIQVVHEHAGQVVSTRDWTLTEPAGQYPEFVLRPGVNTFDVKAVNTGALAGSEEAETTRLRLLATYHREPSPPPTITIGSVSPRGPIDPARPVVVGSARVRVEGRIHAAENLSEANWRIGDAREGRTLAHFEPGKTKDFPIAEDVTLKPGTQRLRFRARTVEGEPAEAFVTINFQPPLPDIEELVTTPRGPILSEGQDPPRVRLDARLVLPDERGPYKVAILVNEEERPEAPVIDESARTLTANVDLQPGENRIRVRLSNDWVEPRTTDPLLVTYRRPPNKVALDEPRVGPRPIVDLDGSAESPEGLPLTRVEIDVNGRGVPAESVATRREGSSWRIEARGVSLERGENRVRLRAWNADGPTLAPAERTITFTPPVPPKADLEILDRDATVSSPTARVGFRVRSASPISWVAVRRGRETLFQADPKAARPVGGGGFELAAAPLVTLRPGNNVLDVEAVNEGGSQVVRVTLSYVPPPVRVVIDGLVPRSKPKTLIAPEPREDRRIAFPQGIPDGDVSVLGRVIWSDQGALSRSGVARVRVWVNDFQQIPSELKPRAGNPLEREFRAEVLLNRVENRIEIEVPGLPEEAGDRPEFRVACLDPVRAQRLHLLIVGIGETDPKKLKDQALKALQGRPLSESTFTTPAFAQGQIYGPLHGFVSQSRLITQLHYISKAVAARDASGPTSDVVVIYFQGDESIDARGQFFLRTSEARNDPDLKRSAISGDDLAAYFAGTRGAHVLLLDVARKTLRDATSPEVPRPLSDRSRAGLLRYAWLNPKGAPAEPARLIVALEEAIPRASKLKDVESAVSKRFRLLERDYPLSLTYDQQLPESLRELVVGQP